MYLNAEIEKQTNDCYRFNMRATKTALVLSIFLSALTACGQPLLVIPGGRLSGEPAAENVDWRNLPNTIQVELRPNDPYSINLRIVAIDQDLFIGTANANSKWAREVVTNPLVRISVDNKIYALEAYAVNDTERRSQILQVYKEKYGLNTNKQKIQQMLLFELRQQYK